MDLYHEETKYITCPVCQSRLAFDVSAKYTLDLSVDGVAIKGDARPTNPLDDDHLKEGVPYVPDLPHTNWFMPFFPVLDASGVEVGRSDGRTLLFRKDLPSCFAMGGNGYRQPVALPAHLLTVPEMARECRPLTVHGPIMTRMECLDEGPSIDRISLARPALDLAYWLCPSVKFFHDGEVDHPFYMCSPDGDLFMEAMGIVTRR